MTGDAAPRALTIEAFDPDRHDRSSFSCGIETVDNYFKRTANKLAKAGNVRLYVLVGPDGAVAGFYAVNAHAVHYDQLPDRFARTRPVHGHLPAAYVSMIARDERARGRGYGALLLADALARIARAAEILGIAVVMLDVLDCGDPVRVAKRQALYAGFGFRPLESEPLRMFLPVATVGRILAALDGRS